MTFKIKNNLRNSYLLLTLLMVVASCMKDDSWVKAHLMQTSVELPAGSIFIVNEGNFMYGNATLSSYDTLKRAVQNDIFYKVNGLPLGDVAESMSRWKSSGFVVVNNSGKIYVMDTSSGKYTGKITGLTSPRYIHIINDQKAYVSDLYAGKISIVNPTTNQITGFVPCPSHPSTEEMVLFGKYLFVTCWSADKTILVIDTEKDQVIREIAVGVQPCGIISDHNGKIWVLCQSLPGNNTSGVAMLQRIDPNNYSIEMSLSFPAGAKPVKLTIDGKGEYLFYLLGNKVYKMEVSANQLPGQALLSPVSSLLYGLGVDPISGDIYVSDALDYQQSGVISRFSASGSLIGTFKAGIIPGSFCFR